jgi:hypothetical protein
MDARLYGRYVDAANSLRMLVGNQLGTIKTVEVKLL